MTKSWATLRIVQTQRLGEKVARPEARKVFPPPPFLAPPTAAALLPAQVAPTKSKKRFTASQCDTQNMIVFTQSRKFARLWRWSPVNRFSRKSGWPVSKIRKSASFV